MKNNNYWINKDDRMNKAKAWVKKMDAEHSSEIEDCVKNTIIYSDKNVQQPTKRNVNTHIELTYLDSVSAVLKYAPEGHAAVLNFASYKEPGGMFLQGSRAQEECLCHESILYNVLREFETSYYSENKKDLNRAMYRNKALYSPNVYFEREGKTVLCDVITCAAPNFTTASKYCNVTKEQNSLVLMKRIKFVLDIATMQNVDTLILGAYGAGVFGQDVVEVATITKDLLHHYSFKNVIFAIIDRNSENYKAFKTILEEKKY